MSLPNYRSLEVWKRAMELVLATYGATQELPSEERYGLQSQMRRASVSVAANIAEGYGRSHRGEYLHLLSVARGSLCELETLLILVVRLKLLKREGLINAWRLCDEVGKMLRALIASLQK